MTPKAMMIALRGAESRPMRTVCIPQRRPTAWGRGEYAIAR